MTVNVFVSISLPSWGPKLRRTEARFIVCLSCFCLLPAAIATFTSRAWSQKQSDNGQGGSSPFHLVSSSVGSKQATVNHEEVVVDPRTEFHVPQDSQVVVVFKIAGPGGMHHLVGTWRGPDGKAESIGNLDMETYPPGFFCYWTLTFPDSVKPGLWALEVQVDGHPVGSQTFQIVGNPAVAAAPPAPPPPPSAGDVYQRVVAATVFIDNQDAQGEPIRRGSGFFIGKGQILTAFQVIDGASAVQIEFPDGTRTTVNQVLRWNRLQDWAVLQVDSSKIQPLERAPAGSWKVGDHAYLLDSPTETGRTIVNVGLSGVQESKQFGERLNTSWFGGMRTIGSPMLDDYGRVIGMEGGSLIPGIETLRGLGNEAISVIGQDPPDSLIPLVTPISLIPADLSADKPVPFSELALQGEYVEPLPRESQVMSGSLCKDYQKTNGVMISAENVTSEFSRQRDMLGVVITWNAHQKMKGTLQFKIFDAENHPREQDQPSKFELQQRLLSFTGIKMPIAQLQPGIYRVDALLNDVPQWRGFFRVTE